MRAFLILMGGIVILFLGIVFVPQYFNPFWNNLVKKIENGQKIVMFSEITDFDWDIVCVLPPYALSVGGQGARIAKYIPYDLGKFEGKIPLHNDDELFAFAFIKNGEVVMIKDKGRKYWVRTDYNNNCISSSKANFRYKENYIHIHDNLKGE